MRPRILYVIDHTEEGGAQVVVRQLIEHLREDFSFSVAVLGRPGRFSKVYSELGASVMELGCDQNRWNPFPVVALIQAIRSNCYELVHTHLFKASILGAVAGKYTRCKIILHDHTNINPRSIKFYIPNVLLRWIYTLLYRLVLVLCHRVIVLTPLSSTLYQRTYSVDPAKIAVVPNGLDPQAISKSTKKESDLIRHELGLASTTHVVTMVGRLEPEKDWLTFLKVAQYLPQLTQISFAFLVVGAGSQEQYLRNYIITNKISEVYFLGYRSDVVDILAASNVFLLTSTIEAMPIALLEAMAFGCPVVATKSGGSDAILTHELNGLLAEVRDIKTIAASVVRILEDDALRARLIQNARQRVAESYNINTITSCIAAIYNQVLSERHYVKPNEPSSKN